MNKKGQVVAEFLMNYGWAILSAIVVICVLVIYFRPIPITQSSNSALEDCLKRIATDYCVSINQSYQGLFNALGDHSFYCRDNSTRESGKSVKQYDFLYQEKQGCQSATYGNEVKTRNG